MARFIFPLENVLKYRRSLEDYAKQTLAKAQEKYGQQKKILEEMKANLEATLSHQNIFNLNLDVSRIIHENAYREYLFACLNKQQELLVKLQQEVNDYRAKLIQAQQERLILEKLKEKSWQKYHLEENKKEQFQIDETGRGIFIYNKRRYQ